MLIIETYFVLPYMGVCFFFRLELSCMQAQLAPLN